MRHRLQESPEVSHRSFHFPIDSTVLALTIPMLDGCTVETVTIGREGQLAAASARGSCRPLRAFPSRTVTSRMRVLCSAVGLPITSVAFGGASLYGKLGASGRSASVCMVE
jgi:hypothetical protein